MRIVLVLLTSLIQIVVSVAGFLVLILALNGYSERQAGPALVAYIILCMLVLVGSAVLAVLTAKKLFDKTRLGKFGASAVSLIAFATLGALLIGVNLFVSIGAAELMRRLR